MVPKLGLIKELIKGRVVFFPNRRDSMEKGTKIRNSFAYGNIMHFIVLLNRNTSKEVGSTRDWRRGQGLGHKKTCMSCLGTLGSH